MLLNKWEDDKQISQERVLLTGKTEKALSAKQEPVIGSNKGALKVTIPMSNNSSWYISD